MDKPIVKTSNAPAPISPVRGSGYRLPTWKKADWNHWEQMPHCKIGDIVALSLDLEPSNPKREIRTWPPEYVKRMQITDAHIECGTLTRSNADWHSIDMSTYGTWALSRELIIPDRFPREIVVKASAPIEALPITQANTTQTLPALFDPVPVEALEKMFPCNGKWKGWAERATRNKLKDAREGRAKFNPYKAAIWLTNKGVTGFDLARCYRTLANNLPARSIDKADLLTGNTG